MVDLNDLRVFASVASFRSFSAAGHALGMPKSSVSRSVARLEADLGTRLVQRTTRVVHLTEPGTFLKDRCTDILGRIDDVVGIIDDMNAAPRGSLKISAGIGFGLNVLSDLLPPFLERYPEITVSLELTSRSVDLVAEGVDVTIRMGPLPDSRFVAKRLGTINRYLCAAPAYLERRGTPRTPDDIRDHHIVEMPGIGGRPRSWTFINAPHETMRIDVQPRVSVNDALTVHRLVVGGAGLGCLSGYLCAPDFEAGRLVRLLPEWTMGSIEVNVLFPSNRELSPAVRAFVDFLKHASTPGKSWQDDPLVA